MKRFLLPIIFVNLITAQAQTLQIVTDNGSSTNKEITTAGYNSVLSYTNKIRPFLVSANYRSGWIMETNGSINFGLNGPRAPGFAFRWLTNNNAAVDYSSNTNELMRLDFDGKLGLGTSAPFSSTNNRGIHIANGAHSSILFGNPISESNGGIIQTSDSKHRIFIGANLYDDEVSSWKNFQANKGGAGISIVADKGGWGTSIEFYVTEADAFATDLKRMVIKSDGNVGIGTSSPTEKLSVKGKIRAQEIKVENTNWPDYVFAPSYTRASLSDLEKFIKMHKHLPEIPSAKEVEESGISLGEMNAMLLKKIEELTLHLIEKDKELKESQKRMDEFEEKLNQLLNAK